MKSNKSKSKVTQRKRKSAGPKPSSSTMGATNKASVAVSRSSRTGRPNITSSQTGSCIRHREFFTDVVSSGTGFQSYSYPINPGVPNIFPWLSTIAEQYETYKFKKLSFEYETQTATTSVGTVMMAVDFDALDTPPATKIAELSYKGAVRTAPWTPCNLAVYLPDIKPQEKYTRAGSVSSSDLKTYDVGNLQVCLQGVAAGTVGELYVNYEVQLMTPQIGTGIGGTLGSAGVDESAVAMFGTPAFASQGVLPLVYTNSSTATFSQSFEGLVAFRITGTVLSANFAFNGTCTSFIEAQVVNAGATEVTGFGMIRAGSANTIVPTITGTTVTHTYLYFAKCPYDQIEGW